MTAFRKETVSYTHTLNELVEEHGCTEVARRFGITHAAVRFMMDAGRQIYAKRIKGDHWAYVEIRPYRHGRTALRESKQHKGIATRRRNLNRIRTAKAQRRRSRL